MTRTKPDIWMPMFWGAYFADTRDFSAEEHGAYLCLIGHYWQTGGPIPNDQRQLLRAACLTGKRSVRVLNRVLSKFLVEGPYLRHKRIDEELEKAFGHKAKAVERARKAADARWKKDASSNAPSMPEAFPGAMLEQCPLPVPLLVRTTDPHSGTVHPTIEDQPSTPDIAPPKKPKREKCPVYDGCVWFRMGAREKELVRDWYLKNGHDLTLVPSAIRVVDRWLAKKTSKAIAARKLEDHHLYLYETWVLEEAIRERELKQRRNGTGSIQKLSISERNYAFFNQEGHEQGRDEAAIEIGGEHLADVGGD